MALELTSMMGVPTVPPPAGEKVGAAPGGKEQQLQGTLISGNGNFNGSSDAGLRVRGMRVNRSARPQASSFGAAALE